MRNMQKCLISLALVIVFGASSPSSASIQAQDAKPLARVPAAAVNAAITRGTEWLLASQHPDGGWEYGVGSSHPGNNALVVYTLLKSGLPKDHEAIQLGFEGLRRQPPTSTYGIALLLMALSAHHDADDMQWAEVTAQKLRSIQTGDFGYAGGGSRGDLSNTQYGALGLRAASQLGIHVPDSAWRALAEETLKYTKTGYGFSYVQGKGAFNATGSMTSAGAAILNICMDALASSKTSQATLDRYESARDHGLEWLGAHFSVNRNYRGSWLGYYLYGLERVGSLCNVSKLGSHDWYNEGATKLVREQLPGGSWMIGNAGQVTGTCYALLFLRRATRAVVSGAPQAGKTSFTSTDPNASVDLVATGGRQLNMWLGNWKKSALERLEWPGETGKGPHIVRVTYFLDSRVVASIEGDDEKPAGVERFPAKIELESGGTHRLKVRVEVAPPPHEIQGVVLRGANELITTELDFELPDMLDAGQLQLVRDAASNLVPGSKPKAKVSSVAPPAMLQDALGLGAAFPISGEGELAIDGRLRSAWIAAADDELPTLKLSFKKAPKANLVILGNAHVFKRVQPKLGRIATVTVIVNSRYEFKLSMPPDENKKARLKLPKTYTIKKLEVRITARVPGEDGYRGVGLSEVELQLVE